MVGAGGRQGQREWAAIRTKLWAPGESWRMLSQFRSVGVRFPSYNVVAAVLLMAPDRSNDLTSSLGPHVVMCDYICSVCISNV
jgi:hypothetical protein